MVKLLLLNLADNIKSPVCTFKMCLCVLNRQYVSSVGISYMLHDDTATVVLVQLNEVMHFPPFDGI